jgi:uncharacterized protein (TIGR03437 family)
VAPFVRFLFGIALLPGSAFAQTVCPSIDFLVARTITLMRNVGDGIAYHTNVVRQADASYTGFDIEVSDRPTQPVISVTPHFERQFANCLPHALPATPSPAAPSNAAIRSQWLASEQLASGNYAVASIAGSPYTNGVGSILLDVFDQGMNIISENEVDPPANSAFDTVALADVNGDGKADLIALSVAQSPTNLNDNYLWVFFGNGDGTFQSGVTHPLGGNFFNTNYSSFAVGDFNGDGKPDLAIAAGNGVIAAALGKGDGTFSLLPPTPSVTVSTGGPGFIAAADLNGDGRLDVVFGFPATYPGNQIFVQLGKGDGTFQSPVAINARLNSPAMGENQIAIGDVNQDGIPDIVTAGGTILFGDGKGAFPSERDYAWNAAGSVSLADVDGDGKIDIIVGNGSSEFISGSGSFPTMTVMFGAGGGAFTGTPISIAEPPITVETYQAIGSGDFNGDGFPDLAFADLEGDYLDILKGSGSGVFNRTFHYSFATSRTPPVSLAIADFNRDGKQDVVVLAGIANNGLTQSEVEVFLGNGDGTLQQPLSFQLDAPNPAFIAAGDFNGDGIPDLAATAQGGVWVWLGKGDGTFSAPSSYMFSNATLPSLAIGDFNRDGRLDIAVANPAAQNIAILLGMGDGTFVAGAVTPVASTSPSTGAAVGPYLLVAADFNGDGVLDLASVLGTTNSGAAGRIAVLLGKGDGTFEALPIDPEPAVSIAAADMNGDGVTDLVVTESPSPTVVRAGNGDGTFQPPTEILSPYLSTLAIADFNLDGKPDIAGAIRPAGFATLLNLSTRPGTLAVVSAASYLAGPFAPDEIVSGFGSNLSNAAPGSANVLVHDSAGATREAQVYYASPGQANFVIPTATALGAATILVTSPDGAQSSTQVQIVPVAPALSTEGTAGIAAAYAIRVAPDNTQTILPVFTAQGGSVTLTPIDLSQPGSVYLLLFGTGFDAARVPSTAVNIRGISAPVQYAGPQLSFAGFDQIGVLLPPSLAGSGIDAVQVTIGGKQANTVYISIQ